jgi:hypothetical protein
MPLLSGPSKQFGSLGIVPIATQSLKIVKTEVELGLRVAFVRAGFE